MVETSLTKQVYYNKERIELASCAIYWPYDSPVLEQIVHDNYTMQLEDANEIDLTIERMAAARNQPVYFLADIRQIQAGSSEAQQHFKGPLPPSIKAIAILVKNGRSKLLGNFFIRLNQSNIPSQLFTDRVKAIEWLLEQKRTQQ